MDSRLLARAFIGLAALTPALALIASGFVLALRGGTAGVLAGLVLLVLGLGLVVVAVLMLRAPEAANWFLSQEREEADRPGPNGRG